MFGSIVEYFYKYLAGIQSPAEGKTSAGYKHIHLEPHVPEKLYSVTSSLETVAGKIAVSWKKETGSFLYKVSVPANTTASVILPVFDFQNITVTEGNSNIWADNKFIEGVPGIEDIKNESGHFEIVMGSGDYTFSLQTKNYTFK